MKLSNKNIDEAMREIEKFYTDEGVARKDKIQLCLMLEETLLRCQAKFGVEHEFKISMRKWFSAPRVAINISGAPFNPLKEDDSIIPTSVMLNLLNYESTGTVYRYENGRNEIIAFTRRKF